MTFFIRLSFSLVDSVNNQRGNANQHFIKDRNELSSDEKETQQKAWRAVFHSLSEVVSSSEMPRRTDVPGTSYSASKPNAGTNLGKYHLMLIIPPPKKKLRNKGILKLHRPFRATPN